MQQRKILVTTALTYANGRPHLGHVVEAIQADIWVRFQRLCGHQCYFVSGSDAHGTAIMIKAREQGISPEALIETMQREQESDFRAFLVNYDHYDSTHSTGNQNLVNEVYGRLKAKGDIAVSAILQAYDEEEGLFLPDRYVKGTCPHCQTPDQYGDNCEACGATYSPHELLNPLSILSGTAPVQKASEHYFFQLQHYTDALKTWHEAGHLQEEVANKLQEWFTMGLRAWDISRDAPYFGFGIPDVPGKYFYVWLDAPVGYFASAEHLSEQYPDFSVDALMKKDSEIELYHFIGKDITYFHALFWPAMLMSADFRTPTGIFVHGFLTINGQKMSKSRNTFISAEKFLSYVDPNYLRYYFASKLGPALDDLDLNLSDFVQKVNTDLVGKVVNIASRCAGFITQHFDGKLSLVLAEPALFELFISTGESIAFAYEKRDFAKAVREIMGLADKANQYLAERAPWILIKDPLHREDVHAICSLGLSLFKLLVLYLKPILPGLAEKAEHFLNLPPLMWADHKTALLGQAIKVFEPMMQRLNLSEIEGMLAP